MTDTVMDLRPLADGRLVYGGGDPAWGVLDGQLGRVQFVGPPVLDHRDYPGGSVGPGGLQSFRLAPDGRWIEFRAVARDAKGATSQLVRFDLVERRLLLSGAAAPQGLAPRTSGLPLRLKAYERSRSVAISADASHFALGGDWYLRLFQADGRERWNTPTPGVAWLVNLSPDGRFVVAALPVGTATALLDGEATAARIQAELARFIDSSRIQPNDVFVLYLAGHGVTDVRGDYVFKTVEASADGSGGLGGRQLLDLLASIPSTHLVVVLDTCAAGSFRDAFRIDLTLRRLNEVSGRAVLAGSASQGSALEHPSLGGGLFTGVLLSGLGGAANNDGNEEVSVQEALVASSGRCFTNPTMISASPARTSAVEGRWNARGGPGWPPWRRGWPGASAASGCSTTGSTRRSLPGPAWMSTCPSSTATKAS